MKVRLALVLTLVWLLPGCSAIPNMDSGSAACQNARGIGQPVVRADGSINQDVMPDLRGKTPAEAEAIAEERGHTVVFNVQGTCWCVPPPSGRVADQWFGEHGALWLWVEGFPPPSDQPPFQGWGC